MFEHAFCFTFLHRCVSVGSIVANSIVARTANVWNQENQSFSSLSLCLWCRVRAHGENWPDFCNDRMHNQFSNDWIHLLTPTCKCALHLCRAFHENSDIFAWLRPLFSFFSTSICTSRFHSSIRLWSRKKRIEPVSHTLTIIIHTYNVIALEMHVLRADCIGWNATCVCARTTHHQLCLR